ncbi:MAG TPA: helix-turn-helix transcriptional regulator [Verrucomicrobiota bacterium]|nr:helix-turn-helix transcriptional regulator [Verrucomicrobiota bacterium]HNU52043.1 helix-turn-helix transcriptional regulator [Verrucomicrobiota bacterium]
MGRTRRLDLEQCPCSGRNLDRLLHAAILTLLAGESLHGYELIHRLAGLRMFRGRKPDPAGVYRLLRQMEVAGLIRGTVERSTAGPARRSHGLTAQGRRCLERWQVTLRGLREAINELLVQESNP